MPFRALALPAHEAAETFAPGLCNAGASSQAARFSNAAGKADRA